MEKKVIVPILNSKASRIVLC